ncbi:MAG: hypothetical protein P4M11_12740 [Candidatus Pacebacteria bacterium]|nr:hypothetical protein [Candidatus Paceibacterota bacterium]
MANTGDLKEVAANLSAADVKLNVIALDFCNDMEFDSSEEKAKACENESAAQQNNKRLLTELTSKMDGKIFPANVAMNIYHQFRKRAVYPVAKYRGSLEISKELNIQVMAYTKTKPESPPSLAKYSLVTEECIPREESEL